MFIVFLKTKGFIENDSRRVELILTAFAFGVIERDIFATDGIDRPVGVLGSIEPMFFWVFFLAPFDRTVTRMDPDYEPVDDGML